MKHSQSKSKSKFLMVIGLVVIVGLVYAFNTWDTGYRVATGTTVTVYGGSGGTVCKRVTNNCSAGDIFVPTKSDAEWQGADGFINKYPSCITISDCGCKTNSDCSSNQFCSGYLAATAAAGVCNGGYYVITPITQCIHADRCCKTPSGTYYANNPEISSTSCGGSSSDVQVDQSYCANFNTNCSVVATQGGSYCNPSSICFPYRGNCSNKTTQSSCVAANSSCSWTQTSAARSEVMGQCTPYAYCNLSGIGSVPYGTTVYRQGSSTPTASTQYYTNPSPIDQFANSYGYCRAGSVTCSNGVSTVTYNGQCTYKLQDMFGRPLVEPVSNMPATSYYVISGYVTVWHGSFELESYVDQSRFVNGSNPLKLSRCNYSFSGYTSRDRSNNGYVATGYYSYYPLQRQNGGTGCSSDASNNTYLYYFGPDGYWYEWTYDPISCYDICDDDYYNYGYCLDSKKQDAMTTCIARSPTDTLYRLINPNKLSKWYYYADYNGIRYWDGTLDKLFELEKLLSW